MKIIIDQMQRRVSCPENPQRIVSLVPSQTELLFALGLGDKIVGRTKFCIHPAEKVANVNVIGGTKNFHLEAIRALKPDLIIGNKEENYEEGINTLAAEFPVLMSDIFTLPDALAMIRMIGNATNTLLQANDLAENIERNFAAILALPPRKALYLIWRNPYMAAGKSTFIDEMLGHAGFTNVLTEQSRYPELSAEQIRALNPEVILLSSEPYPFSEAKHFAEFQELVPRANVMLVDGEMFSWYGSRLLEAAEYFQQLATRLRL
jgi:ABC-type Fe3+-hydroxamate transport system substrate-binding protein